MEKFINHVDHVAWISRPENLDANVAQLEKLTGATLTRFARRDMMNTNVILGDIAYQDGLIPFGPADRA